MKKLITILISCLCSLASFSQAAFTFTGLGEANKYTESFNSIGASGTTFPTGWSGVRWAGSVSTSVGLALTPVVFTSSSSSGAIYNAGTSGDPDRALGVLASGTTMPRIGAFFINNSGTEINSLVINFTFEQWKSGSSNSANEVITFAGAVNATDISTGSYIGYPALNLNEILTSTTVAVSVDGNNLSNKISVTGTITGISVPNGSSYWIRWSDLDNSGSDGLYAIDDLEIIAIGTPSSANSITGFTLGGTQAIITGYMINVTVPSSAILSNLPATGTISANATVNPAFTSVTDYSGPVLFTVTAEDMSSISIYTVTAVNANTLSTANSITGFTLQGGYSGTITGTTIAINVPYATSLVNLTASGTISAAASIQPSLATLLDYEISRVFTVTSENMDMAFYTVTVTNLPASSASSITGFTLQGGYAGIITGTTIAINVPFGTNLSSLTATGVASPFATVNPAFNTALNYGSAQVFTVTAQNMSMAYYTVTVTTLPTVSGFNGIIESFTTDPVSSGWSIYTPKSLKNWLYSSSNGNIEANGFGSTGISAMESWLITPKLTFAGSNLGVAYGGSFGFSDAGTSKPAQVLYSSNYNGSGPVSVAGWSVIADDYQGVVTVAGFKNFTSTGTGYIAFVYKASSPSSAVRWRLDNVSISGASLFTPTVAGLVYNVEANIPPGITLTGITPLSYIRNSVSPVTGLSTIPGSLTITIAGQLIGTNIAANVGLLEGAQFSLDDASGATTVRIPKGLYTTIGFNLVEGNTITVSGILGQSSGLSQFTVAKIIGVDANVKSRPEPLDVTLINESIESKLIRVIATVDSSTWNKTAGQGYNVDITVGGVSYIMRTYQATEIFATKFTTLFGPKSRYKVITITGLGGQFNSAPYNSGYQIVPYLLSDFKTYVERQERAILSFTYLPQPGLSSTVTGTVSGNNIFATVPFGTTITGLVPTIEISPLATISPASGVAPSYVFVDPSYFVNYTVTAEAGNSTAYQLTLSVAPVTGIADIISGADIHIYPNPASSVFKLVAKAGLVVEIYNAIGIKVYETSTTASETSVDAISSKGIYLLKVKGTSISKRIVIE